MLQPRILDWLSGWIPPIARSPHLPPVTPIDARPPLSSAETAKTTRAIRALKAEMDASLSVLRALSVELDRRLRETRQAGTETLTALGQMVGGMAHNLNNGLAVILGYAELLLTEPLDEHTERRLTIIRQVALEAGDTVRRLQELVARQPQGAEGPVSLSEVVAEALEITQPRWRDESERRGVTITVVQDLSPVPPVEGNHADLRQALVYLILNGVAAMPSSGTLTLRSRSGEPGWVELEVTDTGTESPSGLLEASALIEQHGGGLAVESIPDGGTMVRLTLPESRFQLIPSGSALKPCAPEEVRRILLVDDDPRLLRALTDLLEGSGHAVLMAASGADALSRFDREAVDLVITDLGMPGMTGWELAERIKTRSPKTPVFLLTGWGPAVADSHASRFVDRIIAKPVSADAILHHLGEVPRRGQRVAS